jgi:hypothetical protein
MKVIQDKLDETLKELEEEVNKLEGTEDKIKLGYEMSFLKKCFEWVSTESLTVGDNKQLNILKKEGMKRAVDLVSYVLNSTPKIM